MDREQTARTGSRPEVSKADILEQRLRMANTISAICARLARTGSLNARLDESLREAGALVGADRAYVFRFRENGALMDNTHEWCAQGITPRIAELQGLQSETFGWFMEKVRQGEAFQISDVSALPAEAESERSILAAQGIRSLLIMPMGLVGRPTGFVGFDNVREAGEWQPEDIDLLRVASQLMGDALERERSYQAMELRVQHQKAIRESEERYRRLLESLPAIVYRYSHRKGASYWSSQIEDILGFSQRDLLEKPFLWHDLIHPNDLPMVDEAIAAFEVGNRIDLTYRIRDSDGSWHWFHDRSIRRLDVDGDAVIEGLAFDITTQKHAEQALRESEQRYRGVVEDTPVLICRFLPGGEIIFVNEAYCRYFAKTAEELVGSNFLTLIPEKDREIVMRNINALTVDSPTQSHDHRVVTPEGTARWQRWTNRALFDKEGNIVAYQAIGDDITEQKKIDKIKDELISIVSHELRTPITSIRGALGLLSNLETHISEQARNLIEIATRNSIRLSQLIDDLLDAEKLASGKIGMRMGEHDVMELINRSLDDNQPFAEDRDIALRIGETLTGVRIRVDDSRFAQVLNNLIANAVKFSPSNSIVTVSAALSDGTVCVSVSDNGCGIPEDFQPNIFGRFTRADSTDRRRTQGAGLGLSICKQLVEMMQGQISFESEEGRGTTFYVNMPGDLENNDVGAEET